MARHFLVWHNTHFSDFFFTSTVESQLLFAERACVFIVDVGTQLELRATTLKVEKTSLNEIFADLFSLAVHPNKLLIATGQATSGQDRRDNKVSSFVL